MSSLAGASSHAWRGAQAAQAGRVAPQGRARAQPVPGLGAHRAAPGRAGSHGAGTGLCLSSLAQSSPGQQAHQSHISYVLLWCWGSNSSCWEKEHSLNLSAKSCVWGTQLGRSSPSHMSVQPFPPLPPSLFPLPSPGHRGAGTAGPFCAGQGMFIQGTRT